MGVISLALCALLAQALPVADPLEGAPAVTGVELVLVEDEPALLEVARELVAVRRGQRLSLRTVQRSVERLINTGRFADVVVRTRPSPTGVDVIFELDPARPIGSVYVEGAAPGTVEEVLAAAELAPGTPYYPERVATALSAIERAWRRKGYLQARATAVAQRGEQGIDIGLRLSAGEPTRLTAVVFAGAPTVPLVKLRELLGLKLGDVLNLDTVEAAQLRLRAWLKVQGYHRARLEPATVAAGGVLLLPVDLGPQVTFRFEGNGRFGPRLLRATLRYDGSELLDAALIDRLAGRLRDFYVSRGFLEARVRPRVRARPDGRQASLTFEISEGRQVLVTQLAFEGNLALSDDALRAVLVNVLRATTPPLPAEVLPAVDPLELEGRTRRAPWSDVPAPLPEQVFIEGAWVQAADAMVATYRDRGYLSADVTLSAVEIGERGVRARFEIHEGPQAHFDGVVVSGGPEGFPPLRFVAPGPEVPFSERELERLRQELLRALAARGHLYATAQASFAVSDGVKVKAVVRLEPGPQVRVGKVLLRGLERTREGVVRDRITLKEGQAIDPDALVATQRSLLELGIFRTVEVRLASAELKEPVKDVFIEARELARASGEIGVGYFLAEGPRVVLDGQAPNLGGRAINLLGRLSLNYFGAAAPALSRTIDVSDLGLGEQLGFRGNVAVQNRGLLPADIGARVDLVGERVFRQSYRFTRIAAIPGVDWSRLFTLPYIDFARLKLTVQLQYELEWSRVTAVSAPSGFAYAILPSDQQRLRFSFGTFPLQTVRLGTTLDLRDDPALPRRGVLLQATTDAVFDVGARDPEGGKVTVQFLKLAGLFSFYLPVGSSLSLAVSVRGGRIFPLRPESTTPPVKRFYLGGATSMRGFREDQLIADDQRTEYQAQVRNCQALITTAGCSSASRTLLAGTEVASQGGELFGLLKTELRSPLVGALDVGLFFETGNLWLAFPTVLNLRSTAGAGLRYVTPIGPLAVDLGVNLNPDLVLNEPRVVVHFNIGVF